MEPRPVGIYVAALRHPVGAAVQRRACSIGSQGADHPGLRRTWAAGQTVQLPPELRNTVHQLTWSTWGPADQNLSRAVAPSAAAT